MRQTRPAVTCLVTAAVFCILIGTSQMLPLVWDEGELIDRAAAVKVWSERAVVSPWGDEEHASPFSREDIAASWKSTTVAEGHPGGYLAVIALGRTLAECANAITPDSAPMFSQKTAWRLGPILMMSLAMGAIFSAVGRHFDTTAALFSVIAILLVPRVFAHAHFATSDGVLMAAWLLTVATFPRSRNVAKNQAGEIQQAAQTSALRLRFRLFRDSIFPGMVWGLCFGLTLSAKFTGWVIAATFFALGGMTLGMRCWNNTKKSVPKTQTRNSKRPYVIGICVALFVFYLLNPPLWHRPILGLAEFLYLNTHRGEYNVSILFWGQLYHLEKPLPCYNTLVWVAITFPTLFFVMLPFGVFRMFRQTDATVSIDDTTDENTEIVRRNRLRFSWLIAFNAVVLLVVRAIPGTPPHDGVRLFVAAFPFLAIVAGIGMSVIWQRRRAALIARLAVVWVLVVGVGNLAFYAPQWLSFYNAVIGGVSGATHNGFEPTYYWDAFDAEVIAVLNENTAENEKTRLTPAKSSKTFDLVRAWDGLRPEFRPDAPGEYRWYVFQLRPSSLMPVDRMLLQHFEPAYVKTVSQPSPTFQRTRKTPVLYVFEYDHYHMAAKMVEAEKQ